MTDPSTVDVAISDILLWVVLPYVCLAIFIGWHERYQEQPLREAGADRPEPAAHA